MSNSQPTVDGEEFRWEVKASAISFVAYALTCFWLLTAGKDLLGMLAMLLNPVAGGFAIGMAVSGCRHGAAKSRYTARVWLVLSLVTVVIFMTYVILNTSWLENVRDMLGLEHPGKTV